MERYISINNKKIKNYGFKRYISFLEGKKQALKILGGSNKKLVDELEKIDPTKNNKYVELFAKFIKKGITIDNIKSIIKDIEKAEKKNFKYDISKIKTFGDFKNIITNEAQKVTKSSARKGIKGLTKDKDFIEIPLKSQNSIAYIPLNYEASKVIASSRVGECEGKWCTAYQKDKSYWKNYIEQDFGILVYEINYNILDEKNKKQAIYFYSDKRYTSEFNSLDNNIKEIENEREIKYYVFKNWDNIRQKIEKNIPHWIYAAKIDRENSKFSILSNGTFEWYNGIWENGSWKNGTWNDGAWKDGIWENGYWKNGTWYNGIWYDGVWENGVHLGGFWKDGIWKEGKWHKGIWRKGIWYNGFWEEGLWEDGSIISKKFKKTINSKINPKEFYKIEKESSTIEELKNKVS